MTTIDLTDEELWTLYFDAGATADSPWPWAAGEAAPKNAPTDEARQAYKQKLVAAVEGLLAGPCPAKVYHGPGHQSWTGCHLMGPHDTHEARYGSAQHLARWSGTEAMTGFFDEPPQGGADE